MSDKVAYLVGDTKGRDHIYWPIISPEFAASEGLPARQLGVNLATMMALAWRVKKWRVTVGAVAGSLTQVFPEGAPGPPQTTEVITTSFAPADFDVTMLNGATREAGLLYTFFLTFGSGGYGGLRHDGWNGASPSTVTETTTLTFNSVPPESFDPPSGSDAGAFSSAGGAGVSMQTGDGPSTGGFNGVYYDPNTQLFYPEISFGASVALHFGGGGQFGIRGDMRDVSGTAGMLTVDPACSILMAPGLWVPAPAFQLPLAASGNIVPFRGHVDEPAIVSGSVTATMVATEFWPYENSQGLPVYDAVSGVPLRDPFS